MGELARTESRKSIADTPPKSDTPKPKPKPSTTIFARAVGVFEVDVKGDDGIVKKAVLIKIAKGSEHGIKQGDYGRVQGETGSASFQVSDGVQPGECKAFVLPYTRETKDSFDQKIKAAKQIVEIGLPAPPRP
jgi:hypothetical protein